MEVGVHRITEDFILKDSNDSSNEYVKVMLGELISSEITEKLSSGEKERKKFVFSFKLENLKKINETALVTVNSFYQKLLIKDSSIRKKVWDIIMEIVLAYNVVTTLFFLAYEEPGNTLLVIDYLCWVIFIINIGLTLFTERINEKGLPIRSFNRIFILYLQSWMIFDIVAIIPLRAGGNNNGEYYLRMVRLLKLPEVINISNGTGIGYFLTFFRFGKREKDGSVTYKYKTKIIASLVQLLLSVLFIIYFLGCFWYWFQNIVRNYQYSSGPSDPSDIDFNDFSRAYNLVGMASSDVAIRSSYFILTTIATIGYGDYLPKNIYEMACIMCIMLFGVGLFAYIMGNFNNAISYYNEATSGKDSIGEMNSWLDSLEKVQGILPKSLRNRISDHFAFYFSEDRLNTLAKAYWEAENDDGLIAIDQEYVSNLPEDIYYSILDTLFSDFLWNYKYFLGNSRLKYSIIPHLQPRKYNANDFIFFRGTHIEELVFVSSGSISIGIDVNGVHETLLYCEGGRTILGDYSIITGLKNKFDYLAINSVVALVINAEIFIRILDGFYKEDRNNILAIAAKRENNLKRLFNDHAKNSQTFQVSILENDKKVKLVMPKVSNNEEYSEETVERELTDMSHQSSKIERTVEASLALVLSTTEIRNKNLLKID